VRSSRSANMPLNSIPACILDWCGGVGGARPDVWWMTVVQGFGRPDKVQPPHCADSATAASGCR
jgi:hypothetical protein